MKGVIDSYLMTKIFLIAVIIVLAVFGLFFLCTLLPFNTCPIGPGGYEYALAYLDVMDTPHFMAAVLSGTEMDVDGENAPFMEHVYGIFISEDKQKLQSLSDNIRSVMDKHGLDYYEVTLKTDSGTQGITQFGSSLQKCGEFLEGVCLGDTDGASPACGVGMVYTSITWSGGAQGAGVGKVDNFNCRGKSVCCKQDTAAYLSQPGEKYKVIACGPANKGTCTTKCEQGMIPLGEYDDDCALGNQGQTPACCSISADVLRDQNKIADAEIPLFHDGKKGALVVTTSG